MPVTPLRYEDGALLLLDQRALPAEERWLRCTRAEEVAEAIETLAVRGAPAIGVAAAYAMALAAPDEDEYQWAWHRLRRTRPTAVNLHWALERMREAGPERALATAHAIAEREDAATRLIARHGAGLVRGRAITHCNAGSLACTGVGTALGVIRAGDVDKVWVPETRPLLQGARLTAYELAQDGIRHTVVTDSSVGLLMSQHSVDVAVVGADRIAENGDVANKIGTYPMAVLAQRHNVPFYVAAPLSTVDVELESGDGIVIEQRRPEELGAAFKAENWAFDVTPGGLVSAWVTENGVFRHPAKLALVRAANLLVERGLVTGTQGNVSVRDGDRILITPTALPYDEMTEEDVVVLGERGRREPSTEWQVHAKIYAARPEVRAIVHTHSPAATAWSHGTEPLDGIRVAEYADAGTAALGRRAIGALEGRSAVLLARHGVVAVGTTMGHALWRAAHVEREAASRATP